MNRPLVALILIELAGAIVFLSNQRDVIIPPQVEFLLVDQATADDITEVRSRLVIAMDKGKNAAANWLELADVYAAFGYYREANPCYRRTTGLAPANLDAAFRHALCLDRLARFDEASRVFTRVRDTTDNKRRANECLYFMGNILLKQEKHDEAEAVFREGQAYAPCAYQLANILVRTGRIEEAKPLLGGLDRFGNSIWTHMIRARAHDALGESKAALLRRDQADRAREIPFFISDRGFFKPVRARYGSARMYREGMGLIEEGNTHGALAVLRKALKQDYVEGVIPQIARNHLEIGEIAEAEALIDEFIERAGSTPDILELRGDILWERSRGDEAKRSWELAIELRANSSLHGKLARLYQTRQDPDQAAKHETLANEWRGVEACRDNQLDAARQSLEKVTATTPDRARAWFHLGLVYHALGMKPEAARAFERCLKLQPHHSRAKQMKASLD